LPASNSKKTFVTSNCNLIDQTFKHLASLSPKSLFLQSVYFSTKVKTQDPNKKIMNQMPRANPNSSTEKEMVALAEEELARLQRQVKFCCSVYKFA